MNEAILDGKIHQIESNISELQDYNSNVYKAVLDLSEDGNSLSVDVLENTLGQTPVWQKLLDPWNNWQLDWIGVLSTPIIGKTIIGNWEDSAVRSLNISNFKDYNKTSFAQADLADFTVYPGEGTCQLSIVDGKLRVTAADNTNGFNILINTPFGRQYCNERYPSFRLRVKFTVHSIEQQFGISHGLSQVGNLGTDGYIIIDQPGIYEYDKMWQHDDYINNFQLYNTMMFISGVNCVVDIEYIMTEYYYNNIQVHLETGSTHKKFLEIRIYP